MLLNAGKSQIFNLLTSISKNIKGYNYYIIIIILWLSIYFIKWIYVIMLYLQDNQQDFLLNIILIMIVSLYLFKCKKSSETKYSLIKLKKSWVKRSTINNLLKNNIIFYNIKKTIIENNKNHFGVRWIYNKVFKNKPLSDHLLNNKNPQNNDEFGHYLAGLIDGDGHISKINQIIITFNNKDIKTANYIKSKIGYGTIKEIKNKKAINYIISSTTGVIKILALINNKLRTLNKYNQVINLFNVNPNLKSKFILKHGKFNYNYSNNFYNHWLAGFIDSDGGFQIKIRYRSDRPTPTYTIKLQISQKDKELLLSIQKFICEYHKTNKLTGTYLGTRIHKDTQNEDNITYYLETTSMPAFKKLLEYLDNFNLNSKHLQYVKVRKVYLWIKNKKHMNLDYQNKIKNIKDALNS